jgi:hypothetical protein
MSYFKCPDGESREMIFFPDKKSAKKFLEHFMQPYKLATVLYQLPVVLTQYCEELMYYIDDNDSFSLVESADCKEEIMLSTIGPMYPFPILLEKDQQIWLSYFDHPDNVGLAYLLDLKVDASNLLQKGEIILDEYPDELSWEGIRLMYYSLRKRVPVQPSFYPATLYLDPIFPSDNHFGQSVVTFVDERIV